MPVLTSGDQLTMTVPYRFELPPAQTLERLSELATAAALSQLPSEDRPPMLPQLKEEEERSDFDDIQWNERKGELPQREPGKSGINDGDGNGKEKTNGTNGDKK